MLFLSKGSDIAAWRAASDFNSGYRDTLLARTASCRSDEAARLLEQAGEQLRQLADDHGRCCAEVAKVVGEMATTGSVAVVSRLSRDGFSLAYEHFGLFRSPLAFYRLSSELLEGACAALMNLAERQMGLLGRILPPGRCLIALGPAGRREYSPYCPLQLLMIHDTDHHGTSDAMAQFCRLLHESLQLCGFELDGEVTPLNAAWRGDAAEWRHRMLHCLEGGAAEDLIEVSRLCDQAPLAPADSDAAARFHALSLGLLRDEHAVVANLAERLQGLSNGLGLMGRIRTEKEGWGGRTCFGLREHGLIPLSATVSTVTLATGGWGIDTPRRIRELLDRRVLDVEMTERVLAAWTMLNELRLSHERDLFSGEEGSAHHIPVDRLDAAQQEELRGSLETVGIFQRQALTAIALAGE